MGMSHLIASTHARKENINPVMGATGMDQFEIRSMQSEVLFDGDKDAMTMDELDRLKLEN